MSVRVGKMVHYTNLGDKDGKYPPQVQAAIITAVYQKAKVIDVKGPSETTYVRFDNGVADDALNMDEIAVDLKVLYNTGIFDTLKVPFSSVPMTRGHWSFMDQ